MSFSKKKFGAVEEPESKSSKFVAYNEIPVRGDLENIRITKKNMVLSSKAMLMFQGMLWQKAAELKIKKIIFIWSPLVEPGTAASIKLSVSYDIGDEVDDMNAEETVVTTTGTISETLRLDVFPTQPIMKTHDMAFYLPWSATADVLDTITSKNNSVIGILKMWCYLGIKTYFTTKRPDQTLYKEPAIYWSNLHYPFYVPFYIMKKVRGLHSILWRDTEQFKRFSAQVGAHLDEKMYPSDKYLPIMQTLSKDDTAKIGEITSLCHRNAGGYCTCGDKIDKYIASAMANNHGRCNEHGLLFDRVGREIMTGNIKLVNGHPEIKF